jgi:hypothetical protein
MNTANSTNSRGNIIKVPDATPGILFVNGQQQYFTLERVWKSPVAPVANQAVDVEFDAAGAIAAITVVDSQHANKERLNQLSGVAQERGKEAAKLAQQGVGALAARMGWVPLVAAVVLWLAWFFFNAVTIGISGASELSFSFWGLLGIDFNNPETVMGGGSSHGLFSFLGLLAIAAPFAVPFIRTTWSKYLNAAPLAYILIACVVIYMNESKAFGDLSKMGVPNPLSWSWLMIFLVVPALVLGAGALKKPAIA